MDFFCCCYLVHSIKCIQCNSTIDDNCLTANMAPTNCPNSNYTACSKFFHDSTKSKAIYRGCATKKLDDKCYPDDSTTCLFWCDDADGCNFGSRFKFSFNFICLILILIGFIRIKDF